MYRKRYIRRVSKQSKRNLFITIPLVGFILYATMVWILPNFVNVLGEVTSFFKPHNKQVKNISENPYLAPPVFNIPFEATNTAKINIDGFATPNSKVNLYLDDVQKEVVDVDSEGKFIFYDVDLNLGTNNIYGKTLDEKKQESLASKSLKVVYDNEKPNLQLISPADGTQIQGDRKITIEGSTEVDAKVYINGSQIILGKDGKFKIDQFLNDGENIFKVKAVDRASNEVEDERRVNFTP